MSEIAKTLQKAATNMHAFAARNDDFDLPDELVLPFVMNFLTDERLRRLPAVPSYERMRAGQR